jgi:hypothetical protein
MDKQLIAILQKRRQSAGNGVNPLGFGRFGETVGINGTIIFRFCKGERMLDVCTLRKLAAHAARVNDIEMLGALNFYALGVRVAPTMAPVDN